MQTTMNVVAAAASTGALCDLCGTDPHPEYTCLWRRHRALDRAASGGRHFSDDLHARIESGEMEKAEGTALLRRMLERAAANKNTHGLTGSVQELEDDVAAGRPLTRYR